MTLLTPSTRRGDGVFYATPRHRRHRRENAVDAGTGKARSFDLAGAALRLLALCDGNGYILARDARLVDYDSEDAPACDVNDAAHANAAAIHTRRQLALRIVECGSGTEALARGPAQPRAPCRGTTGRCRSTTGARTARRRSGNGRGRRRRRATPRCSSNGRRRLPSAGEPEEGQVRGALRALQAGDDGARVRRAGRHEGRFEIRHPARLGDGARAAGCRRGAGARGRGRRLAGLVRVQRLGAAVRRTPSPTCRRCLPGRRPRRFRRRCLVAAAAAPAVRGAIEFESNSRQAR